MKSTLEKLKTDILSHFTSVHAFCREVQGLSRSSVYLVLAGKYPGDIAKQISKIRAALTGKTTLMQTTQKILTTEEAYIVLQETKCSHCRKQNKLACSSCRTQTAREAKALEDYLDSREASCQKD